MTAERINDVCQKRGEEFGKWCRKRDSNPRPPLYESGALPTELLRHFGLLIVARGQIRKNMTAGQDP